MNQRRSAALREAAHPLVGTHRGECGVDGLVVCTGGNPGSGGIAAFLVKQVAFLLLPLALFKRRNFTAGNIETFAMYGGLQVTGGVLDEPAQLLDHHVRFGGSRVDAALAVSGLSAVNFGTVPQAQTATETLRFAEGLAA